MRTARRRAPRFRVGDWVSFIYGAQRAWAQVIEYRGPLGVNGRHIYRIRLDWDLEEPLAFELPEDDLEPATADKAAVLRYLKEGGLVAILQSHLVRQQPPPRVWLTFNSDGKLTHTLNAFRGLIGDAAVPFFALHEEMVLAAKKNQVIDFLKCFGLTKAEAESVINEVGTVPLSRG